MSPDILSYFSQLIERETGISYSENNLYQLRVRLEELVKDQNVQDAQELKKILSSGGNNQLHRKLIDLATNNETLFFRDPSFFQGMVSFLETEILPLRPREIKIWSAASSTGQEALSVAMTLEELAERRVLPPYTILASDICERALAKCRSGIYSEFETSRGLSTQRREKFFKPSSGGWKVKDSIMNKINYCSNNLIRPTVKGSFHLILCRNVLIYQKIERKKEVVSYLINQLTPDGAMILGVGETLLGVMENITPKLYGNVGFYRTHELVNNATPSKNSPRQDENLLLKF